jgi:hypothetical protein
MALLDLVRYARVQMTGGGGPLADDRRRAVPFAGLAAVDIDTWRLLKGWSSIPDFS